MNPSPGGPAEQREPDHADQHHPPASSAFFRWIRGLHVVRTQDRWVGGVAGGVARRTGLDLALVRGLIVVLVIFGGIGVLLYGLAWALLPEPDGRIHVEQAGRGSWTTGLTGASVLVALGLLRPDLPGLGDDGSGLLWALFWIGAVVLFVYWVVNRSGRSGPRPGVPDRADAAPEDRPAPPEDLPYPLPYQPGQGAWAGSSFASSAGSPGGPLRQRTDPLPQRRRPLRPSGPVTALLVGGAITVAALVLALDHTGVLRFADAPVVALATAAIILALAVIALGVRGRTSGLVGATAAVAAIGALVASFAVVGGTLALAQQTIARPGSPETAAQGYGNVAAASTIDLTGLPAPERDLVVPVNSLASEVTVRVPEDVAVELRGGMPLSSVSVRGPDTTARFADGDVGALDLGRDEVTPDTAGPAIVLDLGGALSDVTLVRVPAPVDPGPPATVDPTPTGETP
ncbi:PspC domain-containing protein [uncultured Arthrobacter sp.]|uniref:PspC domain-containing protein n=1 Tax=uncultured Arthrobacter sp. TaxID=114050 RepID=UPI002613E1C1|nr:PspC domain-containing protein [uncultured Arthrobacter sp.]